MGRGRLKKDDEETGGDMRRSWSERNANGVFVLVVLLVFVDEVASWAQTGGGGKAASSLAALRA